MSVKAVKGQCLPALWSRKSDTCTEIVDGWMKVMYELINIDIMTIICVFFIRFWIGLNMNVP